MRRPQGGYLLSKIDSQYFLLSPDAATSQADRQTIRIPIAPGVDSAVDCSIKGSWFSFGRPSGKEAYWIAQTPSASAWEASAGAVDMKEEWQSFENALSQHFGRIRPVSNEIVCNESYWTARRAGPRARRMGHR